MKKAKMQYECLHCGMSQIIETTKEAYQEVYVCRECNGALVDKWVGHKYKNNKSKVNRANNTRIILTNYIDDDLIKLIASELSARLRNLDF